MTQLSLQTASLVSVSSSPNTKTVEKEADSMAEREENQRGENTDRSLIKIHLTNKMLLEDKTFLPYEQVLVVNI